MLLNCVSIRELACHDVRGRRKSALCVLARTAVRAPAAGIALMFAIVLSRQMAFGCFLTRLRAGRRLFRRVASSMLVASGNDLRPIGHRHSSWETTTKGQHGCHNTMRDVHTVAVAVCYVVLLRRRDVPRLEDRQRFTRALRRRGAGEGRGSRVEGRGSRVEGCRKALFRRWCSSG